ncbi:hypothetical protein ACFO1B_53190 [Dactylosporangium siamense]
MRSSASRRTNRAVALIIAVALTGGWGLAGWRVVDDARGETVDAEVVAIARNDPGRRVYDVHFVTVAGQACESRVDSGSNPPPREIHVGGGAMVHHSASNPCSSFLLRETTYPSRWPFMIVAPMVIAICLVAVWRLRPRKDDR